MDAGYARMEPRLERMELMHGTGPDGTPTHHDTHAPDPVLAREHVNGWFAGYIMRTGDAGPAIAWTRGFVQGVEVRG